MSFTLRFRGTIGSLLFLAMIFPTRHGLHAQIEKPSEEFSRAIEDNSLFVEEAFNQEENVVQHIFNALYFRRPSENTLTSFTQEWPAFGADHQLSYTILYAFLSGPSTNGFGDLFINYRYQLAGDSAWAAIAPRLSIILPTGNADKGLGTGALGWQVNVPISKRLSDLWIVHWNAGMTLFPRVTGTTADGATVKRTLTWYTAAASIIWLAHPHWNLMLESSASRAADLGVGGDLVWSSELIVSPALRSAIDVGDLQIVPALGIPVSFVQGETGVGVFLYLSFEHPF
jgi:hypothetical protein